MAQLEFFPRTEFKSLLDFQRLEDHCLSTIDKKLLINFPDFFQAPKPNEVISRQHSQYLDRILGFRIKYIEEMLLAEAQGFEPEGSVNSWGPGLHDGAQTWVGLDLETLQTPYSEILRIFHLLKLKPYQQVIDLGAAYGRMGMVLGGLYPKNTFTGFEFVKARVDEGMRVYLELGLKRSELKTQDLFAKDFSLPEADIYFIYDYGQVEHINHTLQQVSLISRKRPVKLVVRGKFTNEIIAQNHPWLDLKYSGKLDEKFSIYTAYLH